MLAISTLLTSLTISLVTLNSLEVVSVQDRTLTATKDQKKYSISIDDTTQIHPRFWGQAQITDILPKHLVNVTGSWIGNSHDTLQAKSIRDNSLQTRIGIFIGKIISLSSSTLEIDTVGRGSQTILLNSNFKLTDRANKPISPSDLNVGHVIKIRGVWNKSTSTISDIIYIKDFSLAPTP